MQHSLTLLAAVALCGTVSAQPTLTFNANAPQPGPSWTLHYGAWIDPGDAGTDQEWDFSALESDSSDVISLVGPSTLPGHEQFAGATVAETGAEATMFFRASADGMYLVGSDADGLAIVYSDQARYLPYPCTYQTAWTDAGAADFEVEGIAVERDGTVEGLADAYGTLTMPDGSEHTVLRIHWNEVTLDQTEFFDIDSEYDSYLYYEVGRPFPLVHIVRATVTILGNTVVTEHTQWYDSFTTGLDDVAATPSALQAWPNPATDHVTITIPKDMDRAVFVQFTDATGRAVHTLRTVAAADGRIDLAVDDLPVGVYLVTATDAAARRAVVRVSVER